MRTKTFNPLDYGFRWTCEWYVYDGKPAEKAALAARNAMARHLRKEGRTVHTGSLGKQLVTKGGIGTGRPQIELIVPIYTLTHS